MGTQSKRQHAVTGDKGLGRWATLAGGSVSRDAAPNWNGGATKPDLTYGRRKIDNITTTRPFDINRDLPLLRRLRKAQIGETFTITDQHLDANDQAVGDPDVYTGCVPVKVPPPEYDEKASEGAELSVEWMVEDVTP